MEQEDNQQYTYTIEEKTGNIVKVEKANEEQKKQKKSSKVIIALWCTAIGLHAINSIGVDTIMEKVTNTQTIEVDHEINNVSRNDVLQELVSDGLTLEEAEKKVLAAEEKAANEMGALTELEAENLENGNTIKDAASFLSQTNDYEQLAPKQSNTDNRELLIQSLVNSGLTLEEAEKKVLAAEEKAANEMGALTELEAENLENGNTTKDAASFLNQTNDYETIVSAPIKEKVTEVSEVDKMEAIMPAFDYNSEIDKVLNGQKQVYESADRAINNREGIDNNKLYMPSFENAEIGAIYTQNGDQLVKISLEQAENIVTNGGQVAMLVENEEQGIGYISVGSENNEEYGDEVNSISK